MKSSLYIFCLVLFMSCLSKPEIKKGDTVLIYMKLSNKNGATIDETGYSNLIQPLQVKVGNQEVFKPIDVSLIGMKLNESKTIVLPPENTFKKQGVFYIQNAMDTAYIVHPTDTLFATITILKIN